MSISGIENNYSNHAYGTIFHSQNSQGDKTAEAGSTSPSKSKQAKAQQTARQNQQAKQAAHEFYSYLQKNYDCVKNGSVAISGVYLNECANNPQKAKELEENLSYFQKGYEDGLRNAQANARALGARLLDYSESWNIDSKGNVTVIASSTVTSDNGAKSWKQLAERRQEKLEAKQVQKRRDERRTEQKKRAEERLDKNKRSDHSATIPTNVNYKFFDIQI